MTLDEWKQKSSLFDDLGDREYDLLSALGERTMVEQGTILFRAGEPASQFYLVADGLVALRVTTPSKPMLTIQTLGEGSLLGLSWRVKPFRWQWTAQTIQDTTLVAFDANQILAACEQDHELDSSMWEMVAKEASKRLQNVRMQLLDLYGRESL